MPARVVYQQVNKDHAYWPEKQLVGQSIGGHTAGLLTHLDENGGVIRSILFDVGLGTIQGLSELWIFSWEWQLDVFITHGHPDHHLELMLLSELWCQRMVRPSRGPLRVYCTGNNENEATYRFVYPAHSFRFAPGTDQTLQQMPVQPGTPTRIGIFDVLAIPVEHFDGAVIYVVEFGNNPRHKIIIGWDMKRPPDVARNPVLRSPSLALLEANTWSPLSATTGHTSVTELVPFISDLDASLGQDRYGVFLVHYGGGEDSGGTIPDAALEIQFRTTWPALASLVGVARRGQYWTFDL